MSLYPLPDDDDSDIIDEANQAKAKAAQMSVSDLRGPNGQELPKDLRLALSEYMDDSRADAEAATPVEFRALAAVLDSWATLSQHQKAGGVLVAVCELLDEITEGALSNLALYHEARRTIIYTQLNIRNLRLFMTIFDPKNTEHHIDELWQFLDIYLDYTYFTYENAVGEYRRLSDVCNREVDESFIETGIISQRSYWDRFAFGGPPAYEEE